MHPDARSGAAALAADADDTHAFLVPASNEGARAAIERVLAIAEEVDCRPDDLDLLQIALAEVLNNIVEHAYARRPDGPIELFVELKPPGLHMTIWDEGDPMPAGRLPGGRPADPGREGHEQEEGGYGLYLIRQLARKLRYERIGDRNRLSFRIPLNPG